MMFPIRTPRIPGKTNPVLILNAVCILMTIFFLLAAGGTNASAADKKDAPVPSAGLVNDQLRKTYPGASAWDIGGQFRVRYEAKSSGAFPNRDFARDLDSGSDYFLFRTKVHIGWSPRAWLTAFVEGRDASSARDTRVPPENDRFDLYQAYVRIGNPGTFPLSLKAGRQELIYGDQRHIGNSEWTNRGRSFDAVKLMFETGHIRLDAFTGRIVLTPDGHFNNPNHADWLSGLYASSRALVPWQDTELYVLASNVGPDSPDNGGQKPRDIYTVGARWQSLPGRTGNWDYNLEAAGQFGSVPLDGRRQELRAYAVNASGGYTWKDKLYAPRLGGGYDFGSGDSDPSDDRTETFQLLYGGHHRLFGNMDLAGLRNIRIPRLEASVKPTKKVTITAEWLAFWLADTADFFYPQSGSGRNQNGYGRNPGFSSHLGQEIDLIIDWRVRPWAMVRTGYGRFIIGDYLRRSINSVPENGSAVNADGFYLQFSGNF